MRIAVISDIHGNRTAFDAVVADVRGMSPDLVLHGGDLADGGSSPAYIVDRIRDLGWQGVAGNTDEMLFAPESLQEFAKGLPKLAAMFAAIEEMARFTRDALGEERIAWVASLPLTQVRAPIALVHASPGSLWRAPAPESSDDELQRTYAPLAQRVTIYGHIHRPFVRNLGSITIANSGSVGLPYDGDQRAAYVLVDNEIPTIRRVEYDVESEIKQLTASGIPYAAWTAKMLRTASPQVP